MHCQEGAPYGIIARQRREVQTNRRKEWKMGKRAMLQLPHDFRRTSQNAIPAESVNWKSVLGSSIFPYSAIIRSSWSMEHSVRMVRLILL